MKGSKMRNLMAIIVLVMVTGTSFSCTGNQYDKSNRKKNEGIVASMSLKEKAQLLIGTGMAFNMPDSIAARFGGARMVDPNDSVYSQMVDYIRTFVPGSAGNTAMFKSQGITTQVLADGPAGLRIQPKRKGEDRTYYCTAFPIATLLASTWDTDMVYEVGKAMGEEVLEYGVDIILGPGMNLQRDPLCGRNFEYYSEDPLITGKMAASLVKGIQSNGVGTSIKHFAANNQETNRLTVNTIVSERALRELYLKGFEIAVKEAQPWTVMSSYNKINGQYASESNDLLTKILRDDWGFKGYVMTDWSGGSDLVAQMKAGNDLIMPGQPSQIAELVKAVNDGKLDESVLDLNVSRILNIMLETPKYKGYKYSNNPALKAHAEITRQAAANGMVLLENNGTLPLTANVKKVAAFGNTSYDFISGGTGSGDVNEAYTVSLIQGLSNQGYTTSSDLKEIYSTYTKQAIANHVPSKNPFAFLGARDPIAEMPVSKQLSKEMAQRADIALITIGRNSGEGRDREPIPGDYYLSGDEQEMIANVSEAFHAVGKKVVVILNIGGAIETASWKHTPDAVLLAWQPGQEAGNSVVDVLTGKVNPSGKLAVTFPVKYEDSPTASSFPGYAIQGEEDDKADMSGFSFMRRVPWEVVYREGIFVGYRYYNTFDVEVSYPFGYGLSYTSFKLSDLKISSSTFKNKLSATVNVTNTGNVEGREVVEVYLSAPDGEMDKAKEVLINFGKTRLLKPGEMQTVTFEINPRDLCSFDESTSSWVADKGEYTLKVGTSSIDIKLTDVFTLAKDLVVETVSNALLPNEKVDELKLK